MLLISTQEFYTSNSRFTCNLDLPSKFQMPAGSQVPLRYHDLNVGCNFLKYIIKYQIQELWYKMVDWAYLFVFFSKSHKIIILKTWKTPVHPNREKRTRGARVIETPAKLRKSEGVCRGMPGDHSWGSCGPAHLKSGTTAQKEIMCPQ